MFNINSDSLLLDSLADVADLSLLYRLCPLSIKLFAEKELQPAEASVKKSTAPVKHIFSDNFSHASLPTLTIYSINLSIHSCELDMAGTKFGELNIFFQFRLWIAGNGLWS